MANTQITNDSEQPIDVAGQDKSDNTTSFTATSPSQFNDPTNIDYGLPGQQTQDNTINWLGSSYTGVDIKVVANLYSPVTGDDPAIKNLQDNLETNTLIGDGAANILAAGDWSSYMTGFPSTPREDIYLRDAGLFAPQVSNGSTTALQGAEAQLLAQLYATPVGNVDTFRTILSSALQDEVNFRKSITQSLTDQISNLQTIRKKSLNTVVLANLQTLSIQTHREKFPVRSLGESYVKGYTRGPRTIAGSMIFTIFNEHALAALIRAMSSKGSIYGEDSDLSTLIADQLPPIDLTIVFANEYGSLSQAGIYGVEFVNDSMTMSIEDLLTESVVNFVARDVDVMTSKGNIRLSRLQRGMNNSTGPADTSGTDLLFASQDSYNQYLDKLRIRRRLSNR